MLPSGGNGDAVRELQTCVQMSIVNSIYYTRGRRIACCVRCRTMRRGSERVIVVCVWYGGLYMLWRYVRVMRRFVYGVAGCVWCRGSFMVWRFVYVVVVCVYVVFKVW